MVLLKAVLHLQQVDLFKQKLVLIIFIEKKDNWVITFFVRPLERLVLISFQSIRGTARFNKLL